jgi:hypothetical protein
MKKHGLSQTILKNYRVMYNMLSSSDTQDYFEYKSLIFSIIENKKECTNFKTISWARVCSVVEQNSFPLGNLRCDECSILPQLSLL